MRVMWEERGTTLFGEFLGLYCDPHSSDVQAVVRPDQYGLMLKIMHPSKIAPETKEARALFG